MNSENQSVSRRGWLARWSAALVAARGGTAAGAPLRIAGVDVEFQIASISRHTFRLTVLPLKEGRPAAVPSDGSLVQESWGAPVARWRGAPPRQAVKCGDGLIRVASDSLAFTVESGGRQIQRIGIDAPSGAVSFATGDAPLFGLGEGGPQFDRRGSLDRMRSGQGGYQLRTHGGRLPIPWIVSAAGWALFVHQPYGSFDFRGPESRFQPASPAAALPLDIFFIVSPDPAAIMAEYARLTGHP
ncbi:MAG: glycoside hydrolase, partial [Acidobacteriia bacterium]|nr:glycoside hydrolase [Terriglobia bacterium]